MIPRSENPDLAPKFWHKLGKPDKMPRKVWHNVLMSQTAAIPVVSPPPFTFDWREIERGLPLSTLEEFSAYSGIAVKDLLEVVIPARTLKHRRQRHEPFNPDESDRLARVARLYELAVKVFGDPEKAKRWLTKPKLRFDERTPLSMMHTGLGGQGVEEMLYQIDEGAFA
jgi:putative toxin-antitoxin system antitoxin component (TIGR02293 family)